MYDKQFDPYDFILSLQERLLRLEQAHNLLADVYQQTQTKLEHTRFNLDILEHRQKSILVRLAHLENNNAQLYQRGNEPL